MEFDEKKVLSEYRETLEYFLNEPSGVFCTQLPSLIKELSFDVPEEVFSNPEFRKKIMQPIFKVFDERGMKIPTRTLSYLCKFMPESIKYLKQHRAENSNERETALDDADLLTDLMRDNPNIIDLLPEGELSALAERYWDQWTNVDTNIHSSRHIDLRSNYEEDLFCHLVRKNPDAINSDTIQGRMKNDHYAQKDYTMASLKGKRDQLLAELKALDVELEEVRSTSPFELQSKNTKNER